MSKSTKLMWFTIAVFFAGLWILGRYIIPEMLNTPAIRPLIGG